MAPLSSDVRSGVLEAIATNKVMIFSKTTCPFCKKVKELFSELKVHFQTMELDQLENGNQVQDLLQEMTGQRTVPNVFIGGAHIGGCDDTLKMQSDGKLLEKLSPSTQDYEYDLVVIGGGSGGLAAAKEAASFGKRVAVCDFVKPTPKGTKWGLGGTCVNVGCIPKKLMHQAALLGEAISDSKKFGWEVPESGVQHKWVTLKEGVQSHIGSLNWGYRVALKDKDVTYVNGFAQFQDAHTIETTSKRGKKQTLTSERFLLAMGMRPRYPDIPGVKEYAITSDDLFSLSYCPGKTLCIGASYVSLECAGFLAGIGLDVTVMVRSILLRGFDQEMADKVGAYMEKHSVNFIRKAVPTRIERLEEGQPGKLRVYYKYTNGDKEETYDCNTVLMAIGRDACTKDIGLEKTGVIVNPKNGKIPVVNEQTNIPHIYAVGDILEGKLELTPVAIQAGRFLARRLYGGSTVQCEYDKVPTTVFTPLEYGACGLAEEDANQKLGQDNVEVYHSHFQPLEYTVAGREENVCYAKIICDRTDNERVIGLHVIGPHAGEMTQGYAVAMKAGATKEHFDATIGIHPTSSEMFTTLSITKRSGVESKPSGC